MIITLGHHLPTHFNISSIIYDSYVAIIINSKIQIQIELISSCILTVLLRFRASRVRSVSRKKPRFRFGTVRFSGGQKGKLRNSPIFNIIQRNHHKKILKDQI